MVVIFWIECCVIIVIFLSSNYLELDVVKLILIFSKFLVSYGEIVVVIFY